MRKKGFTLIELLVVIAIIALLATIAVISLGQARSRARDARRLSDVKQIQTALALYDHDAGSYPANLASGTIAYASNTYMTIIPTPPLPDDGCVGSAVYTYTVQAVGSDVNGSYSLRYCLGSATSGVGAGLNTATPAGIQ
ncbi:MAG: type II secretion system protein [Candidatus Falkowbacteria bacterium]|nr:type II secretion system protein [Candidatus Falkowbacteria bacterium]